MKNISIYLIENDNVINNNNINNNYSIFTITLLIYNFIAIRTQFNN